MPIDKKHKWDVAISYAGEDRKIADRLVNSLKKENRKLSVFYDKDYKSYLWGKKEEAYENIYGPDSRVVVALISKHYKEKDWPRYEFSIALKESKKRKEESLLAIKIDDSELLGLRNDANYMDIRENSIKEIAKILVEKCKTISKNETANQIGGNNQTCILSVIRVMYLV